MGDLPLDHLIDALRPRFGAAASGAALVVVVDGEPGTGRSRTIGRLATLATGAGLRVADVRAAPHESQIPYAVIGALAEELGAKVCTTGGHDAEDVAEVAARVLEAAAAHDKAPGSCLLVDDAAWADDASLRVLLHAARRLRDRAVVLVLATGPEDVSRGGANLLDELRALPHAALVRLGPFDTAEARALVEAVLGPGTGPSVHERLVRRTGGNPFLLASLLDHFSGLSVLDETTIEDTVPDRVRATVAIRLARLGPEAVALARAVHVLGEDATLARAVTLADLDRRAAEDAADALIRIGVLRPGAGIEFVQPLVGDAVGRCIEPFALDRLHRHAAELLAAECPCPGGVAKHLLRTTPTAQRWIVERLVAAADEATESGDCATAAALLRRALDEPPSVDARHLVLAKLAFAESRAGHPDAVATIDDALTAVGSGDARLMLLRERSRLMWLTGRLPEAVDTSEAALAESEPGTELHDQLLAELLAVASMHDLAPIYARRALVALLDRANSGWVPDSTPLAATLATVLPFVLGDHRLVGPLVDRAVAEDLWRVDAPPFGLRPDFVIGSLWLSDALDRGTRIVHEGMATVDAENLFRHGVLHYWLGELRYAAGDLTGAIDAAEAALAPRWGPFLNWFGFSSATLVHAHLDLDDPGRAEEVLARTEGRLDPHQLTGIGVDLARARLLLRTGRPSDAVPVVARVADGLDVLGHRDGPQIVWRPLAAAAALAGGDADEARSLLEEEVELADATRATGRLGRALRGLARVVTPPQRLELLHRSRDVLAASERRLEHARTLLALGIALHESEDVPGARAALTEAREIAEACTAAPLANRALTALHATGARPRRTARTGVDALTRTERRIVEHASAGNTNREIGELLEIAPRTVEWHLSRAFTKLDVRSRRDLPAALERRPTGSVARGNP